MGYYNDRSEYITESDYDGEYGTSIAYKEMSKKIDILESEVEEMEVLRDRACESYDKIVQMICGNGPLNNLDLGNHLIQLASCIGADMLIKDEIMIKRKPVTESEIWWRTHDEKLNDYEKKLNDKGLLI